MEGEVGRCWVVRALQDGERPGKRCENEIRDMCWSFKPMKRFLAFPKEIWWKGRPARGPKIASLKKSFRNEIL